MDHNPIGSEGFNLLAKGLSMNKTIKALSITYCNIGDEACLAIQEFLLYQASTMQEFNLSGNEITSEGIIEVFRGLAVAKSLTKIYLAAMQWTDEEEVLEAMHHCMTKNKLLLRYDFKNNQITDDGIYRICEILGDASHVIEVEVPPWIELETLNALKEAIAKNKPGKGKKKKKK